jgi:hypothetical protein
VKQFTGATYAATHDVSSVLFDDDTIFASNYAKPLIVFAHAGGACMMPDKATIRTPLKPKTGAFPAGEGLIFMCDSLSTAQ